MTCILAKAGDRVSLTVLVQDPSGRSFKLSRRSSNVRQKQDLAARLAAEKARAGGQVSSEMAKLFDLLNACSSDPEMEENFFFWIAEKSLSKGRKVWLHWCCGDVCYCVQVWLA